MKKLIFSFLMLSLVVAPFATKAVTVEELQAQISALLAQISSLQAQIQTLQSNCTSTMPISLGTPVVKLKGQKIYQAYSGGIQWLKAEFNVDVTAKGGDIYLPVDSALNSQFQRGNVSYLANGCQRSSSPNKTLPVVQNSLGLSGYKIEKGKTVRFNSYVNCPVGQLFAGNYNGILSSLRYQSGLGEAEYKEIYPNLKTGNVYIVGEKGPWIKSTEYTSGKNTASIYGERLKDSNVYFNGTLIPRSSITYNTPTKISFVLPTYDAGNYLVYVSKPILGDSNKVSLSISSSAPLITILAPGPGSSYTPGQQVSVFYTVSGFPRPINVQIQLNKGAAYPNGPYNPVGNATVYVPANGSYVFTIPANAVPGNDYSFMINSDYPSTETSAHFQTPNFSIVSQ